MKIFHFLVSLLLAFSLGACNNSTHANLADSTPPDRVVSVEASDLMRFAPESLTVQAGETVRFQVTNTGAIPHEFILGNAHVQAEHASAMAQAGAHNGELHHGDLSNYALTIQPGETANLTYTFEEAGTIYYGCHLPGHYAAGMKGAITIATAR